jgi:DNA polymerase III subunit delta'
LRPLSADDVACAAAAATGRNPAEAEITAAAAFSEGSVRRALTFLDGDALQIQNSIIAMLDRLPAIDARALHALGDRLAGTEAATLAAFVNSVNGWLSTRLTSGAQESARRDRMAQAWEKINSASRDVEIYNLDRKPLVFNIFGWLAEALRG